MVAHGGVQSKNGIEHACCLRCCLSECLGIILLERNKEHCDFGPQAHTDASRQQISERLKSTMACEMQDARCKVLGTDKENTWVDGSPGVLDQPLQTGPRSSEQFRARQSRYRVHSMPKSSRPRNDTIWSERFGASHRGKPILGAIFDLIWTKTVGVAGDAFAIHG